MLPAGAAAFGTKIMGSMSMFHWVIVGAVALLLFGGRGKISSIMGDFAKGIKSFKKGLADEDTPPREIPRDDVKKDTATHS